MATRSPVAERRTDHRIQRREAPKAAKPKKKDPAKTARTLAIGLLAVAAVVIGVSLLAAKHKGGGPKPTAAHHLSKTTTTVLPTIKLTPVQKVQVTSLDKVLAAAKTTTPGNFKLTYSAHLSGAPSTVLIETMAPNQLFKSTTTELLVDGKKTYYCYRINGMHCSALKSADENPFAALMRAYTASTYVPTLNSLKDLIIQGRVHAYDFSTYQQVIVGERSHCVSWGTKGSQLQYCIASNGLLTYVGALGKNSKSTFFVRLTSFSTKVAAADFTLPKATAGTTSPVASPRHLPLKKATPLKKK